MSISDSANIAWCQQMFSMLAQRGTWAVPRSGLIFQKQDDKLVLIKRMPYAPEMSDTLTPEQLTEQQDADAESIRQHFKAAGIEVRIEEITACPECGSTEPDCEPGCSTVPPREGTVPATE